VNWRHDRPGEKTPSAIDPDRPIEPSVSEIRCRDTARVRAAPG